MWLLCWRHNMSVLSKKRFIWSSHCLIWIINCRPFWFNAVYIRSGFFLLMHQKLKLFMTLSTLACVKWGYAITNLNIAVCINWVCCIVARCIRRDLFVLITITVSKILFIYFQLIRISWRRWSTSWRLPWQRSNTSRNTWRSEREYTVQVRHPHWSCVCVLHEINIIRRIVCPFVLHDGMECFLKLMSKDHSIIIPEKNVHV